MPLPHAVTRQKLQAFPVVSFSREKLTTATTRNICGVKELPGKTMRIISVHRQRESRRVWTFATIQMRCRGLLNTLFHFFHTRCVHFFSATISRCVPSSYARLRALRSRRGSALKKPFPSDFSSPPSPDSKEEVGEEGGRRLMR